MFTDFFHGNTRGTSCPLVTKVTVHSSLQLTVHHGFEVPAAVVFTPESAVTPLYFPSLSYFNIHPLSGVLRAGSLLRLTLIIIPVFVGGDFCCQFFHPYRVTLIIRKRTVKGRGVKISLQIE